MTSKYLAALAVLLMACNSATAAIRITEWMYQGNPDEEIVAPEAGEFVELTNIGNSPIDMTGWWFRDSGDSAAPFDLSEFGIVLPGESVVWTDWSAPLFKDAWGLGTDVDVIGFSEPGLGRGDTINIYDAADTLVDTLQYDDRDVPGPPRTRQISANVPLAALGMNDAAQAIASSVGDELGSYMNTRLEVGNPGIYTPLTAIPEPASLALVAACGLLLMARRSR